MKRSPIRKLNNKGAALIMVILCMLFVFIISSIVLFIVTSSSKNIFNSAKSTSTFYSAEKAVDEIRSNLQEYADKAAREAYTQWLQQYSHLFADGTTETPDEMFKRLYVADLQALLNGVIFTPTGSIVDIDSLLESTPLGRVDWYGTPTVEIEDGKVVIKNIGVECEDAGGYLSLISTDMVFDILYPGFAEAKQYNDNLPCASYSLISDTTIHFEADAGSKVIHGNIYGGGLDTTKNAYTAQGIYFENGSSVNINADYVLTRGNIALTDNTNVNIQGLYSSGSRSYTNLWAKNVDLGATFTTRGKPSMTVKGDMYIADDLTLDAEGSKFKMTAGNFYGYNMTNSRAGDSDSFGIQIRSGTPEGSSAVVINGKNSSVDLSNAGTIWVAGKTFVTVPSLASGNAGETGEITATFQQGESIAYRSLQAAYLLPGECVVGVGHNPMTIAEYAQVIDATNDKCYIDTARSREKGGVDIERYVMSGSNAATPNIPNACRVAYVKYKSGDKNDIMVYLYLNFISTNAATSYFKEYAENNKSLVDSRMNQFGTGTIKVNTLGLVNTGNIVAYDGTGANVIGSNYVSADVNQKQIKFTTKYKALTSSLDENDLSMSTSLRLTENIVDFTKLTGLESVYTGKILDGEGNVKGDAVGLCHEDGQSKGCQIAGLDCKLYTGSNVTISSNSAGIVVSSGDVTVDAGVTFYGLIIAKGAIYVGGGASIKNSEDILVAGATIGDDAKMYSSNEVIKYIIKNEPTVQGLFKISEDETRDANEIYTSDLISLEYRNWKKE